MTVTLEQWTQQRHRFGPAVKRLRGDFSLRVLGGEAGMSPSSISLIERGLRMPKPETAERLATALGSSIEEMIA